MFLNSSSSLLIAATVLCCVESMIGLAGIAIGIDRLQFKSVPPVEKDFLIPAVRFEVTKYTGAHYLRSLDAKLNMSTCFKDGFVFQRSTSWNRNRGLSNCSINLHLVITIGIFLYAFIMVVMWSLVDSPDIEPPGLKDGKEKRDEENKKQGHAFGNDIFIVFASAVTISSLVVSIQMSRAYTDDPHLQQVIPSIPTNPAISNAGWLLQQPGALNKVQAEMPAPADASASAPAETV
jgi:lysylphosphatidylglycerol synthetase-like protein (DUF2156 family)